MSTDKVDSLLDGVVSVDGVVGAFVINADARVVASRLPQFIAASIPEAVASRLLWLMRGFATQGDPCRRMNLEYGDEEMHLFCCDQTCLLAVLFMKDGSHTQLKMAASIAVKGLVRLLRIV